MVHSLPEPLQGEVKEAYCTSFRLAFLFGAFAAFGAYLAMLPVSACYISSYNFQLSTSFPIEFCFIDLNLLERADFEVQQSGWTSGWLS